MRTKNIKIKIKLSIKDAIAHLESIKQGREDELIELTTNDVYWINDDFNSSKGRMYKFEE